MKQKQTLQKLIAKEAAKANTHAVLLGVQAGDGGFHFHGAAGAARPGDSFFLASITKMFTATVLLQLVDQGVIHLAAPLQDYLPHVNMEGIHVQRGIDYSREITVVQLLHQTSGLADYYEDGLVEDLKQNKDRAYDLGDVLTMVRGMDPAAPPGGGKSHYSDTNYQLLGAVVEAVTGARLAELFQARIFTPLQLAQTALFDPAVHRNGSAPLPLYHRARRLHVPLALASMGPDGGAVSTVADTLRFLRGYFAGELFDPAHLRRARQWNDLFFPLQYGYGLMRFKLPRWMTLFRETPELLGHSGSSGSFAFFAPQKDLYLAGTFNQIDKPQRPFNFMLSVLNAVEKAG